MDVRLPKADEADEAIDTVVQPDVLVVCDERKISERGVRGAPDFVVEVLSPATAGHDHVNKRRVYERHGIRRGRGRVPRPTYRPRRTAGAYSKRIGEQRLAAVEVSRARVIKRGGVRAQDRAVDDAAEDQLMVAGRMVAVQRAIEIRERVA